MNGSIWNAKIKNNIIRKIRAWDVKKPTPSRQENWGMKQGYNKESKCTTRKCQSMNEVDELMR